MPSDSESEERGVSRLGAFMDGVFAIAITLPIVRLVVPNIAIGGDLAGAFGRLAPEYVTYGLSFIVIGLYWTYSHFSAQLLKHSDHGYNLLTLLFLASVSLTPFPAQPYVEHFRDPANIRAAALLYGGMLSVPTAVWLARWQWGLSRHLYHDDLARSYVRHVTMRYAITCVACLLGWFVIVLDYPRIGMAMIGIANLGFLVPPRRAEYAST